MIRSLQALLLTLVTAAAAITPGSADPPHQLPGDRGNFGAARSPPVRVPVGAEPNGVDCAPGSLTKPGSRPCPVKTAAGFTGKAPEFRRGTFEMRSGSVVHIVWAPQSTEEWSVQPLRGLVRLAFRNSGDATDGYAYGSKAELSTRRAMSSVHESPRALPLAGWSWDQRTRVRAGMKSSPFKQGDYRRCKTPSWCMTRYQPSSSPCDCKGSRDTSIQYYLARVDNHDRRDTWWHWCTCLTAKHGQLCHSGNSHVKPLLQVLDDSGEFRGWVGVEASFSPYGTDTEALPDHMLGVLQFIESDPA
ncbi:hypothetical protein HLK59_40780 [Streptomyces sp. S3(2020)]|uniref:hypothetical protein n=1 Tax=Streptomyces sp. S3(2020) TaxID=2732044 RepID=UPI0014889482|nr:hypothetical protein [Streptomyces sp. S3(2020)]NNN36586.1 hypothetical protein [Streptomyces sp. S3(2020)]